jgi:hypothetical protein
MRGRREFRTRVLFRAEDSMQVDTDVSLPCARSPTWKRRPEVSCQLGRVDDFSIDRAVARPAIVIDDMIYAAVGRRRILSSGL